MPYQAGAEVQANTSTSGTQERARVTTLAGGGYVVTWIDVPSHTVFGQRYDDTGQALGGELTLATTGSLDIYDVTALHGGGFLVVTRLGAAQAFDSSGTPQGAAFQVFAANDVNEIDIETLASGDILFTYTRVTPAGQQGPQLTASIFSPTGNVVAEPFVVASSPIFQGGFGAVALTDGSFWIGYTRYAGLVDRDIHGKRYSSDGTLLGSSFITDPSEAAGPVDGVALANGNFAVVYHSNFFSFGGNQPLKVVVLAPDGTAVSSPYTISSTSLGHTFDLAALSDGGFVVTWHQPSTGESSIQQFTSAGVPTGPVLPVSTDGDGSEFAPDIAFLDNARLVVAWQDSPTGGATHDIRAQIFTPPAVSGPVASVDRTQTTINEGDGSLPLSLTLSNVTAPTSGSITVSYVSAFSSAGNGTDISAPTTTTDFDITDPTGGTFVIDLPDIGIIDDGTFELSEWFTLQVTITGATFADGTSSIQIRASLTDNEGFGTSGDDVLVGTSASNQLYGLGGNDWLEGRGGADLMDGGPGNDGFLVDRAGDVIVERVNEGFDIVYSPVNYTLGAGVHVEVLSASDHAATTALALTGNELSNELWGNAGNNTLSGGAGADVMVGFGGNDTYLVDNPNDLIIEAANQGSDIIVASSDYVLNDEASVETIRTADPNGTAPLHLSGNSGDNFLEGNAGNNVLSGGGGADLMVAGGGDDIYWVDNAGDTILEYDGAGRDTIYALIDWTLGDSACSIEILAAGSPDSTAALNLTGNLENNELWGSAGANVLNGAGGADVMLGFAGDDIYHVDHAQDDVYEFENQGRDIVYASASYQLTAGSYVEILSAIDNGATTALNLIGNDLANEIWGTNGANVLDGAGGADLLIGFAGDDIYHVNQTGDQVVEASGQGRDIVYALGNYQLTAGSHVEILSSSNNASTQAQNLTGNELANELWGTNGANVLDGAGGADVMIGFDGDDIYYVDNAGDDVYESGGQGRDIVYAGVNYVLTGGSHVEVLSAADNDSAVALNLTGNQLDNELRGTNGANVLDGAAGFDVMIGYAGDDIYYVDSFLDNVFEVAGQGHDTVYVFSSYNLTAGSHVEILSAANNVGVQSINLAGNEFNNELWGTNGANVLDGRLGADILVGFGGADTYAFTTALGGGNVDLVIGFETGVDKIGLDDSVFTALSPGALPAGAFVTGAAAQDADDRIIYDPATGALLYDADGSGAGAAVQFATLGTGLSLSATDFQVF